VSGIDEEALLEKLAKLEAETRQQELDNRRLAAELATCRRERTEQAVFAVRAEDATNSTQTRLEACFKLLQNVWGMLETYDQRIAFERWPELKEYVK
jgi:hypothetical protein